MKGKKDTNIFVTVDTKKINDSNIDQHVEFSDDRSNPKPGEGRPQDFVSEVSKGKKVFWEGLAKDGATGDIVEITGIISKDTEGKGKILERVETDPGRRGRKVGHIKNVEFKGEEAYSVTFRINGGSGTEYIVDPKLRMVD